MTERTPFVISTEKGCKPAEWRNLARLRIGRQTFFRRVLPYFTVQDKIPRLTLGMTGIGANILYCIHNFTFYISKEILRLRGDSCPRSAQDDRKGERLLRLLLCHPELVVARLCCQHFCRWQNARLARRLLLFPKISLRCDFREPCFMSCGVEWVYFFIRKTRFPRPQKRQAVRLPFQKFYSKNGGMFGCGGSGS